MTAKQSKKSHPNVKRMSVTLSSEAAQLLEWLAETQGITQAETLRKAITTEAYLYKEIKQGSKVLILTSEKKKQEVVFR
jgi:predicted DNA-binding protein